MIFLRARQSSGDGDPRGGTLLVGATSQRSDDKADHGHQHHEPDHPSEDGEQLPEHNESHNDAHYPQDPGLVGHKEEPSQPQALR